MTNNTTLLDIIYRWLAPLFVCCRAYDDLEETEQSPEFYLRGKRQVLEELKRKRPRFENLEEFVII